MAQKRISKLSLGRTCLRKMGSPIVKTLPRGRVTDSARLKRDGKDLGEDLYGTRTTDAASALKSRALDEYQLSITDAADYLLSN